MIGNAPRYMPAILTCQSAYVGGILSLRAACVLPPRACLHECVLTCDACLQRVRHGKGNTYMRVRSCLPGTDMHARA
jgi:hypothetical protein